MIKQRREEILAKLILWIKANVPKQMLARYPLVDATAYDSILRFTTQTYNLSDLETKELADSALKTIHDSIRQKP
jgi:hypothetical protein